MTPRPLPPELQQALEDLARAVGTTEAEEIALAASKEIGGTGSIEDWLMAIGNEMARREPELARIAGWPVTGEVT